MKQSKLSMFLVLLPLMGGIEALVCGDLPANPSFSMQGWVDRLRYTVLSSGGVRCHASIWQEEGEHPSREDEHEHEHDEHEHMLFTIFNNNNARKGHAVDNDHKKGHYKMQYDGEDFSMYMVVLWTDYESAALAECASENSPIREISVVSAKNVQDSGLEQLQQYFDDNGIDTSGLRKVQQDETCKYE